MAFDRSLTTVYDARTAGFERGTRTVETRLGGLARTADSRLRDFDRRFERSARSISALGTGLSTFFATIAGTAVIGRLRQAVASLDEIGKTADKLGLTTDALQEYRAAAEAAGIAQATFDMAIQRFGRRVAEARQGTGEAKGVLQELGIELTNADGTARGLEQVLADVAERMTGVAEQTDRNRIAMKLFDSEGVVMVNLLREGADGMARMREEARALGVVIDESLIRRAEEAQTQLDLLARVIDAQVSAAILDLAPVLTFMGGELARFARDVRDVIAEIQAVAALANNLVLAGPPSDTADDLARLREQAAAIRDQMQAIGTTGSAAVAGQATRRALERDLAQVEARIAAISAGSEKARADLAAMVDQIAPALPAIGSQIESPFAPGSAPRPRGAPPEIGVPELGSGGGGRAAALREERDAYAELIASASERAARLLDEVELLTSAADQTAYLEEKQRLLNDAVREGIVLSPEQMAEVEAQARGYAEIAAGLERLKDARELVTRVTEEQLSVEEKILQAKQRLAALLPEIVQLTGDEARAQEILAHAMEDAEEQIRGADEANTAWVDGLLRTIETAESATEALKQLGLQLLELAANDFFNTLAGNDASGPFASLFGSLLGGSGGGAGSASAAAWAAFLNGPTPSIAGFDAGGPTGGARGEVRGVVHGEEYVVRAGPAQRYRALLDAINDGALPGFRDGGYVPPSRVPLPALPAVPQIAASPPPAPIVVEGSTIVLEGSRATAEELERVLDRRDRRLLKSIEKRDRLRPRAWER